MPLRQSHIRLRGLVFLCMVTAVSCGPNNGRETPASATPELGGIDRVSQQMAAQDNGGLSLSARPNYFKDQRIVAQDERQLRNIRERQYQASLTPAQRVAREARVNWVRNLNVARKRRGFAPLGLDDPRLPQQPPAPGAISYRLLVERENPK